MNEQLGAPYEKAAQFPTPYEKAAQFSAPYDRNEKMDKINWGPLMRRRHNSPPPMRGTRKWIKSIGGPL